jgi:hypothetical protein
MNVNELLAVLRRVLLLDRAVFPQVRDDPGLTVPAAAGAGVAVLIAGIGAWLYGQTVWDGVGFGFFDTVVLGSLFTALLFMAGFGVVYVMLIQVFRIDIAPDALVRLLSAGSLPYAIGLLVCIPDLGFAFGLLSIIGVFCWTLFALRSALPAASELKLALAVVAGMAVWMAIIPFISGDGNEFVTGVFVYGLIA